MTEKKELIFKALVEIIEEQGFHGKIKVSEIAKRAGIGKGTVYEYFSSKEEIMFNTIIYLIDKGFNEILNFKIDENPTFESILKNHMSEILESATQSNMMMRLFMSQDVGKEFSFDMKLKLKKHIEKNRNIYQKEVIKLYKYGIDEGIISSIDEFDVSIANLTILASLTMYVNNDFHNEMSKTEFIDNLYTKVIKILN